MGSNNVGMVEMSYHPRTRWANSTFSRLFNNVRTVSAFIIFPSQDRVIIATLRQGSTCVGLIQGVVNSGFSGRLRCMMTPRFPPIFNYA